MSPPLSQETFHKIRDFIYAQSGLSFPDGKKYLIERRLASRLQAAHCRTFEDYFNFVRFDPNRDKEIIQLLNCVTTNETFFFRDISQMDCFRQVILPQIMRAQEKKRTIKIWSAGCSSGEEPYTLAMVIAEEFPVLAGWDVQIVATDLSEQMLQAAKQGVYGPYAVRNIPPAYLQKYFTSSDGRFLVRPILREYVKFSRLNLFDSPQMRCMKKFDVIFCRNVLIYFDQNVRKQIISQFYDALSGSGSLIIGFSESLSGVNRLFRPVPWHKTFFYNKADQETPTLMDAGVESELAPRLQHAGATNASSESRRPRPIQPMAIDGLSMPSAKCWQEIQIMDENLRGRYLESDKR